MFATKPHTDKRQLREIESEIEILERKRVALRKRLLRRQAYQQERGVHPGESLITDEYIREQLSELREQILSLHEKYKNLQDV